MSLLTPRRESRSSNPVADLFATRRLGSYTTAGQTVTATSANRLMAIWRCKHLLADMVSGLELGQFRNTDSGERQPVTKSAYVASPSELVDDHEWRNQVMLSALDCGNAFGLVTKLDGAFRFPTKVEILDPADMRVKQTNGLAPPVYVYAGKVLDTEKVRHFRAFGPAPGSVMGMDPLEAARQTIGLGLAVREYGANWYGGGGHPTSLLQHKGVSMDDAQATSTKKRFRQATSDDHLAILSADWTYIPVQAHPESSLFLAATNATGSDICGYYGIPGELLGYAATGSSVTYANREQRMLDLLTFTVQWWVGRLERFIGQDTPKPQYVSINIDGLLRSDPRTKAEIDQLEILTGVSSPNEIRREQYKLPYKDGDVYAWPPLKKPVPGTVGTGPDPVVDPLPAGDQTA